MICFEIPFTVLPKQADRSRIVNKRDGTQFVQHYQPKAIQENIAHLVDLVVQHRPPEPLRGPLGLYLEFRYPWRKSEPKKSRARGWRWRDVKPDCDNLAKQICDVLEKAHFFINDAQLAGLHVLKMWADNPGVTVVLGPLPDTYPLWGKKSPESSSDSKHAGAML